MAGLDEEWVALAVGLKPAIRCTVSPAHASDVEARLRRAGLAVVRADAEALLDGRALVVLYAARSAENALALRDAEARSSPAARPRMRLRTSLPIARSPAPRLSRVLRRGIFRSSVARRRLLAAERPERALRGLRARAPRLAIPRGCPDQPFSPACPHSNCLLLSLHPRLPRRRCPRGAPARRHRASSPRRRARDPLFARAPDCHRPPWRASIRADRPRRLHRGCGGAAGSSRPRRRAAR